jgi:hypothetical protein
VVVDPYTERSARYETFIPGDSVHYHSSACEVKQHWISGADEAQDISGDNVRSVTGSIDSSVPYIDDDEEYADHVEYVISRCSDNHRPYCGQTPFQWRIRHYSDRRSMWSDSWLVHILIQVPRPARLEMHGVIFKLSEECGLGTASSCCYKYLWVYYSSQAYFLKIASKDPTMPYLGQWIFKGYIHERNFVGRWRETSTVMGMAGLEGSFVMTLRREMS